MKILLVDNNTTLLDSLVKTLLGNEVVVMAQAELKPESWVGFDAVVLTGGRGMQVQENESEYASEMNLIRSCSKPMLGICLGHELIVVAHGIKLAKHAEKQHGDVQLEFIKNSMLFKNVNNGAPVHVSHWFYVSTEAFAKQSKLQALATCGNQVMAFKHASKPIFGVQFHPEMSHVGGVGKQIIKNFLSLC